MTFLDLIFFLSIGIIFIASILILIGCLIITLSIREYFYHRDKTTLSILLIASCIAIGFGLMLMYILLKLLL